MTQPNQEQLFNSFCLEGKITTKHAEQIKEALNVFKEKWEGTDKLNDAILKDNKSLSDEVARLEAEVQELKKTLNSGRKMYQIGKEEANLGFVRQYFGEITDDRTFTAKEIWGIMNIFNPLVPRVKEMHDPCDRLMDKM
jgi:hypothetical protein